MRACRALVAGFGRPAMRDLDFGRQLIELFDQLDWPEGVIVEALPCSVPLVLDRLQELRPAKLVLLGAVSRDLDPPGTIRRYRPDAALDEADIDHTLKLARKWGGLPADTVVIEVEPAETSFGPGFSEELAACLDPIVDIVRDELLGLPEPERAIPLREPLGLLEPTEPMADLIAYARTHAEAKIHSQRAPAIEVPGLALAGRVRPWGVYVKSGGDWFDAVPLGNGSVGIVVGDVGGRGVEAAAAMGDLRAAVRAYAVLDGDSPARLVRHLDVLAETTGLGRDARVLCLTIDPGTGDVRFVNAGGCPPLIAGGPLIDDAASAPIGTGTTDRPETTFRLAPGATLLLYTDGLVRSSATAPAVGIERLRRAAACPQPSLGALCDGVLETCTTGLRRDDDICLLGVRLEPAAIPAPRR